jgi:hypothetical protein
MRRKGDESPFREPRGKVVVGRHVPVERVARYAVSAVLTDHDGPPLAGLQVLRHDQNAPGEDLRPHIQHYIVGRPVVRFRDLASARMGRLQRLVKTAHAVGVETFAEPAGGVGKWRGGMHRVRLLRAPTQFRQFGYRRVQEEPVSDLFGCSHQRLYVLFELPHGLVMPLCGLEPAPEINRHVQRSFFPIPFRTETLEELAQGLRRAGPYRLAGVSDNQRWSGKTR